MEAWDLRYLFIFLTAILKPYFVSNLGRDFVSLPICYWCDIDRGGG
jgi:hypothetical protein